MLAAPVISQSGSFFMSVTVSALRKSPGEYVSDAGRGSSKKIERRNSKRVVFINLNGLRALHGALFPSLAFLFATASKKIFEAAHVVHIGHSSTFTPHKPSEATYFASSSATHAT